MRDDDFLKKDKPYWECQLSDAIPVIGVRDYVHRTYNGFAQESEHLERYNLNEESFEILEERLSDIMTRTGRLLVYNIALLSSAYYSLSKILE